MSHIPKKIDNIHHDYVMNWWLSQTLGE